ncbi:MAG: hypothetical protein KBH81_12285 [Phycisphaerae bacterium]|jgi:hypothetical protein|nr:hypothetical protein [Phycisphaerae bacterium]HPC23124.1 hypothetical protein [Phycisphaerae bacterium]
MSRKRHITPYVMTDGDYWRIANLLRWGGFHYKTIARRLWYGGDQSAEPRTAELRRIGKVAKKEQLSPLDWRNGETEEAVEILANVNDGRVPHLNFRATHFKIQPLKLARRRAATA